LLNSNDTPLTPLNRGNDSARVKAFALLDEQSKTKAKVFPPFSSARSFHQWLKPVEKDSAKEQRRIKEVSFFVYLHDFNSN
jgi:hypothetical protein